VKKKSSETESENEVEKKEKSKKPQKQEDNLFKEEKDPLFPDSDTEEVFAAKKDDPDSGSENDGLFPSTPKKKSKEKKEEPKKKTKEGNDDMDIFEKIMMIH